MTIAPEIINAARSDAPKLLNTVTLAFASDPVSRYWWPDAGDFMRDWPRFALAMGERGFDKRSVFAIPDHRAVAFWLPPGVDPDPAQLAALNLNSGSEENSLSSELQAALARCHPTEPHWYLWLIAVDPCLQGTGLGSALLKHTLKPVDEAGAIAFLECSNPKNVPLYRRFGFEITGEVRVRDVPVIYSMTRAPSKRTRESS